MSILVQLILLSFIIVYIVDLSGVIDETEKGLAKWLKVKSVRIPKPFSCSLCLTWWCGLVLLLVNQSFTIGWIAVVAGISYLTPPIYNLCIVIREGLNKLVEALARLLRV